MIVERAILRSFIIIILSGLCSAQPIKVVQQPKWGVRVDHDNVTNTDTKIWTMYDPKAMASISVPGCENVNLVVTDVLDVQNKTVTVSYRGEHDLHPFETTSDIAMLHGATWSLERAIKAFWGTYPHIGRKLFVRYPVYPEGTKDAVFFLPPVPHECR